MTKFCIVCGSLLTGRQQKFCCPECRATARDARRVERDAVAAQARETMQRSEFLAAAAELGTLTAAADRIGVARTTLMRWRREDSAFRQVSDDALDLGCDSLLSRMVECATADELDLDRVRALNLGCSQMSKWAARRAASQSVARPVVPVPFVPGGESRG